jgi:hypothetical protein
MVSPRNEAQESQPLRRPKAFQEIAVQPENVDQKKLPRSFELGTVVKFHPIWSFFSLSGAKCRGWRKMVASGSKRRG